MPGLLADKNAEGQFKALFRLYQSEPWRELWDGLELSIQTFAGLGLADDVTDLELWKTCQENDLVLLTANRNYDGPESLEAAIRGHNTPDSLPVIILADPKRVLNDRPYGEAVAEALLEYLVDLERLRVGE